MVRVSRRVGRGACVTPPTVGGLRQPFRSDGGGRSARTACGPRAFVAPVAAGGRRPRGAAAARRLPRPRRSLRGPPGCNSRRTRRRGTFRRDRAASGPVVALPRAGKCARPAPEERRASPAPAEAGVGGSARRSGRSRRGLNPGRGTSRSRPFAAKRFHVLLNSLFKVLFNFPSRYLFAIGLVQVFSLRWSLPPSLGCIPKQPDSGDAERPGGAPPQRPNTRRGTMPRSGEPARAPQPAFGTSQTPQLPRAARARGFGAGLDPASLAVTGGIPVGFFSSAY